MDVFEDPFFQRNTSTQTDRTMAKADIIKHGDLILERMVGANCAKKTIDRATLNYSTTFDSSVVPESSGVWWLVWLMCRTEKGWWTVCWYKIIAGTRVVCVWWYADVHVHLLDARF